MNTTALHTPKGLRGPATEHARKIKKSAMRMTMTKAAKERMCHSAR